MSGVISSPSLYKRYVLLPDGADEREIVGDDLNGRDWKMTEEEEVSDGDDEMEGFTRGVDTDSAGTDGERERRRAETAGSDRWRRRTAVWAIACASVSVLTECEGFCLGFWVLDQNR